MPSSNLKGVGNNDVLNMLGERKQTKMCVRNFNYPGLFFFWWFGQRSTFPRFHFWQWAMPQGDLSGIVRKKL